MRNGFGKPYPESYPRPPGFFALALNYKWG
jgi:hypothetical protein